MNGKSNKEQLEVNGSKGLTFNLSTGTDAVNIPLIYLTHFNGSNISSNNSNICSEFSLPVVSIIFISISLLGKLNPVTVEPKKESFNKELN